MLTRDVKLDGFTSDDWTRLGEVFRSRPERSYQRERDDAGKSRPSAPAEDTRPRRGGVIAVTTGSQLRKLVSTEHGRVELRHEPWPQSLEDLCQRHHARWAAELNTGALEALMDRTAERLRRDQEMSAQLLEFVAVLRELEAEGALRVHPWKVSSWPVPRERVVERALDALCPDNRSIVVGVFERGEVYTCIAARRRGAGFDRIMGPDELRREMGLISGDWTRDYRHLARAVEDRLAPLSIGLYAERATFHRLAERPLPGAWAAAVAARDVILTPVAPVLAIPLGLDVGRAAFATARDLAERLGAGAWFGPESPLGPAFGRLREFSPFERDLTRILGFDPLQLLRKLLSRDDNASL